MADATCKRIDDMEATFRGSMRKVRAELGLTSFGVQTIDLPPDSSRHPWHDHVQDGQEEMYIALEGSGVLELESGERFPRPLFRWPIHAAGEPLRSRRTLFRHRR